MTIANRTLGAFWILIGSLIGLMAMLYMIMFAQISTWFAGTLGANTPIVDFLTSQLGPGLLNWWGLGLAVFLILLGVRLLALAPVSRPVAMAFHLLFGLFLLIITLVLFMTINQVGGTIGAAIRPASNAIFYIGLGVSLLLFGIGASLATKTAWDSFMTGGAVRIVSEPMKVQDGPVVRDALLRNLDDGTVYPLPKTAGQITIGSEAGRNIILNDPTVSRNHAVIEFDNNDYRLTDSNSSNGTFVNGKRLIVLGHTLQPDDEIQLGKVRLQFEI